jgi:RNA polymerase sigma factor FliA
MATQTIPNYERLSSAAVAPMLRRRPVSHRTATSSLLDRARQARERERLLVEMLPLVKRIAYSVREHLPSHVELDELMANGVLGLIDAVEKFDAGKQVKLESYARHRIRGAILDGLRSVDPAGRDLRRLNKKIQALYRELESKLGRPAKDEEMSAAMGMNLNQWHKTVNEIRNVGVDFSSRALSAGPSARLESVESALLARAEDDPFERCYRSEQRELVGRALCSMRERDREIIALYYQQELTMKQIAERLKVDESRVSQLHAAAVQRLKAGVEALVASRQAKISSSEDLAAAAA